MIIKIIKTEEVTYNETDNAIMDMVASQLDVDRNKVDYKSRLVDDLGADSLDLVELIMAFEDLLDCEVEDSIAENMTTVKHILDYCENEKLAI